VNLSFFENRSEVWKFDTNERFLDRKKSRGLSDMDRKEIDGWTEAQITRHREEEKEVYIKDFKHDSTHSLVNSFIWDGCSIFFSLHWWLYQREARRKP